MRQKIAVLGAGSWGTALACVLIDNGHDVCLWGKNVEDIEEINTHHTNQRYLKDIVLPEQLKATTDLEGALHDVDAILFVVPTNAVRSVAKDVAKYIKNKPYIIHATKGLEQQTTERISEILKEELPVTSYADIIVLSGPSHAEEVAKKDLTSITAASLNLESAKYVQKLFMNTYFRVYTNTDVIGVELGAALKNIIAIGSGILTGVGYGDNARAGLITRGLAEMTRFGLFYGADATTFSGLSGVGDLIVTCTSVHSRNFRLGHLLGQGHTTDEALQIIDMAVEGAYTVKVVSELAHAKGIDMPITQAIYRILYEGVSVETALLQLMRRDGKSE